MTQTTQPHKTRTLLASLLACCLIPVFILSAGVALAGDDDKIIIKEQHKFRLQLDGDMDVIEVDDLEIGESRQFFTDEGKEIVVTRGEDGVDITVDGEEIDMPKVIRVETLHEEIHGDGEHGEHGADVKKVIVRSGHSSGHNNVWVTSGDKGKAIVEIENLGDGHEMHWVSSSGEDIQIRRSSAAEHLKESGALDGLDESERQAILDALEEFDSESPHRKMIFIEKDEDGDEG